MNHEETEAFYRSGNSNFLIFLTVDFLNFFNYFFVLFKSEVFQINFSVTKFRKNLQIL